MRIEKLEKKITFMNEQTMNKEISKAIRKYKNVNIIEAMEENKSMKAIEKNWK